MASYEQDQEYQQWRRQQQMENDYQQYEEQMRKKQMKKKMSDGYFGDFHQPSGAPKPMREISREFSNESYMHAHSNYGVNGDKLGRMEPGYGPPPPQQQHKSRDLANGDFKAMFNADGSIKRVNSTERLSRNVSRDSHMDQQYGGRPMSQPPPQVQRQISSDRNLQMMNRDGSPMSNQQLARMNSQNQQHEEAMKPMAQKPAHQDREGRRSSFTGAAAGGIPPPIMMQNSNERVHPMLVMEGEEDMAAHAAAGHVFLHSDDMVGVSFQFAQKTTGAAAIFFLVERESVPGHWAHSMTIAGLVCGVACANYIYMKDAWVQSKQCPRVYRYLDWFITVPMQVIEFWMILAAVGDVGLFLFVRLLAASLAMLTFGYLGESTRVEWFNVWLGFGLSMTCWGYIIFEVTFGEAQGYLVEAENNAANIAFFFMRIILIFGWSLYPAGYVLGQVFAIPIALMRLNIAYNVADLVNKVAFGLSIYIAAMQEADEHHRGLLGLIQKGLGGAGEQSHIEI